MMVKRQGITLWLLCFIGLAAVQPVQPQWQAGLRYGGIVASTLLLPKENETPFLSRSYQSSFLTRVSIFMNFTFDDHFSSFALFESVRGLSFNVFAMGVHWKPFSSPYLQFRVGKFQAPFGNFLERRFAPMNPVIGLPLIYDYAHNLSAFDIPGSNAVLLESRGSGIELRYRPADAAGSGKADRWIMKLASGHLPRAGRGMRILSRELYLTGIELVGRTRRWRYALAVTNGSVSNPADLNPTGRLNLLGRLIFSPTAGFVAGLSMARGAYLNRQATEAALSRIGRRPEEFLQTTVGLDLSYSYRHLEVWAEGLWNRYETPFISGDLDLTGWNLEMKYKLTARLFLAFRYNGIRFAEIEDPTDVDGDGALMESWDYNVQQWEVAVWVRLHRNGFFKMAHQWNRTQDVPQGDPADDVTAFQFTVYF